MQILLTLILIYNICYECVIYEILRFPELYTVKTFTINVPKNYVIVKFTDLNKESESTERNHYLDIYSQWYHLFIQQFMANISACKTENGNMMTEILSRRHSSNSEKNIRTNTNRIYRRKLLFFGYEPSFYDHPTKFHKFNGMHGGILMKSGSMKIGLIKRNVAKDSKPKDENIDSEIWDNWSNWSACSVTCGQGRQVRWRHCSSENCKGLKKAQLKSCRLKDCKGFLNWLGIKS